MSVAGIVLAIIAIILSGCTDAHLEQELQNEQEHYCEMVQLRIDSSGEYGWADYKGIFDEQCK